MTTKAKWAWIGATVGTVAIGCGLWTWRGTKAADAGMLQQRSGVAAEAASTPSGAIKVPRLSYEWRQTAVARQQDQLAWDIELTGTLDLYDLAGPGSGDLVGRTHSTRTALRHGDKVQLESVLTHLRNHAETPFRYLRAASGTILAAGFPEVERDNERSHLRTTLAALQLNVARPESVEEPSSIGPCSVGYRTNEQGIIAKSSTRCDYASANGAAVPPKLATFRVEGTFTLGDSQQLTAGRYVEETTLGEGNARMTVQVTTELRKVEEDTAVNPFPEYKTWALFPLHGSHVTTPGKDGAASAVTASELEILGTRTYADLVSDLSKALQAKDLDGARLAIDRLRILFRAKPENMALARAEIQRGLPARMAEPIMGAMSMAGGKEAEAQLLKLVQDSNLDPDVRESSIAHLGSLEAPSDNVVSTLAALSADKAMGALRPQAVTSLGASLRRGAAEGGSPVQDQAFEQLVEMSKSATTTKEQVDSMLALGNTASESAVATISQALASADPMVRDSAVFALREIGGPEIDAKIVSVLAGDPEVGVRLAATRALAFRDLSSSSAEGILKAVQAEPAAVVREAVLGTVASGGALAPESNGYPIVEWIAQNDPDAGLRQKAATALGAPRQD